MNTISVSINEALNLAICLIQNKIIQIDFVKGFQDKFVCILVSSFYAQTVFHFRICSTRVQLSYHYTLSSRPNLLNKPTRP